MPALHNVFCSYIQFELGFAKSFQSFFFFFLSIECGISVLTHIWIVEHFNSLHIWAYLNFLAIKPKRTQLRIFISYCCSDGIVIMILQQSMDSIYTFQNACIQSTAERVQFPLPTNPNKTFAWNRSMNTNMPDTRCCIRAICNMHALVVIFSTKWKSYPFSSIYCVFDERLLLLWLENCSLEWNSVQETIALNSVQQNGFNTRMSGTKCAQQL